MAKKIKEVINDASSSPVTVILGHFRTKDKELYSQAIQQQNQYLTNHRNIGLVGITMESMLKYPISDDIGNTWPNLRTVLLSQDGIHSVNKTKRVIVFNV